MSKAWDYDDNDDDDDEDDDDDNGDECDDIIPTAGQVKFSHLNLAPVNVTLHKSVMLVAILDDMFLGKNKAETCSPTQWNKQVCTYIFIGFCYFDLMKYKVI